MSADSLELTLTTDKPAYRAGEPIELTLRLINRSSQARVLEFSNSQRYDFEIADSSGGRVWKWNADRMFAQMLGTERLAPGESREYRERFTGQLPPGTYRATGIITTSGAGGAALRASTTFTVRSGG
jgi:hypothetical protein